MAQQQDEEQAPRKTTTYNKFEGMASQNERYNVKQNEMFWIENIMRTGPRKLSSIPGPGTATGSHFPPWLPPGWIIHPGTCPDCPCLTSDDGDPTIFFAVSAISSAPCSRFVGTLTCDDVVQISQAQFESAIVGNPLSGVAVRVSPTATAANFTGYGLAYDPGAATQKLSVVKWLGASLQTLGTILSSQNITLSPSDVVTLTATTIGGANELRVFINNIVQSSLTVTDSGIPTTNNDAGFIVVGNTGADDRMEWTKLKADCGTGGGGGSPTGACCDPVAFTCGIRTEIDCLALGRTYLGDDTTCAGDPCACVPCSSCPQHYLLGFYDLASFDTPGAPNPPSDSLVSYNVLMCNSLMDPCGGGLICPAAPTSGTFAANCGSSGYAGSDNLEWKATSNLSGILFDWSIFAFNHSLLLHRPPLVDGEVITINIRNTVGCNAGLVYTFVISDTPGGGGIYHSSGVLTQDLCACV